MEQINVPFRNINRTLIFADLSLIYREMKDKTKRIFLAYGKMIKKQLSVNHSDLSEFKSVFSNPFYQ
ncbi:MAG: hypothetical protein PHS59_12485 [Paludibacter sp.]|nr:hypothetical protein [Paludibacter sp.]